VNYLDQLQPFYQNSLALVIKEDKKEMAEAVSHLLAAVPLQSLGGALELFCVPVAKRIHEMISSDARLEVSTTLALNDSVDELGNLLTHIEVEPNSPTHPVLSFLENIWVVLDLLITKHGALSVTAEPIARCLRKILEATKTSFAPLLPHLLTKLVQGFESSKLSCYLWIAAKCVRVFGADEAHQQDVRVLLESLTNIVFQMVQHPEVPSEEPEIGT
jgi:transportin-3